MDSIGIAKKRIEEARQVLTSELERLETQKDLLLTEIELLRKHPKVSPEIAKRLEELEELLY